MPEQKNKWCPADRAQAEGRLHRTRPTKKKFDFLRILFALLTGFLQLVRTPWCFHYRADDFEQVFYFGPLILNYDCVTDWILFLNQRSPTPWEYLFSIPAWLMNAIKSLLRLKVRLALGYIFVGFLDNFGEVISRGHWQLGYTHINYEDDEGWSFHRHPELRWRFNILGFNVGKGGIYLLRKCWGCDQRDFLKQNFRGPDECVSKSHECDHCFALNDEQYYKQLELTPRMRYDQSMYHGVTWLEAFLRFEILQAVMNFWRW